MGFLKFLKRDKSKEPNLDMEDLDMPPLPPDFKEKGLPELPELPEIPEKKKPLFEIKEKPISKTKPIIEDLPKPREIFPKYFEPIAKKPEGDIKISHPLPSKPMFGMEKHEEEPKAEIQKPLPSIEVLEPVQVPEEKPYESFEKGPIEEPSPLREEPSFTVHKETEGPVFINVHTFKHIISETNTIKSSLRKADQSITKLNEIEASKEKVFAKWRTVLMDLQKKLTFIDKTFFKGDLK